MERKQVRDGINAQSSRQSNSGACVAISIGGQIDFVIVTAPTFTTTGE